MKQKIEGILRHYQNKKISDENLISSAVLVPLFYHEGQYYALFTQRSNNVKSHKGQICFPGGRRQPGDASLLQTALREAEEEIGLKCEDVEILGSLDDNVTLTHGCVISPFVALIPYPYPFKADRREVEQILTVPLSALMDKANFRQEYQTIDGKTVLVYCYKYGKKVAWGATARIIKQFIELLRSGDRALK